MDVDQIAISHDPLSPLREQLAFPDALYLALGLDRSCNSRRFLPWFRFLNCAQSFPGRCLWCAKLFIEFGSLIHPILIEAESLDSRAGQKISILRLHLK